MSDPMRPNHDLDGLLRRFRLHTDDTYLAPGDDPRADALLRRVVSSAPRRRRRWTRFTFSLIVLGGVAGTGVTVAVLRSRAPDNPATIACHSGSDPTTSHVEGLTAETGRDAVEVCGELWLDGTFATEGAPELVACVNEAGATAVLPGPQALCGQLGWDLAELGTDEHADPASELIAILSERFDGQCFDGDAAAATVGDVLTELGLQEWTIVTDRASDAGCNVAAPDPAAQTITIVALPQ